MADASTIPGGAPNRPGSHKPHIAGRCPGSSFVHHVPPCLSMTQETPLSLRAWGGKVHPSRAPGSAGGRLVGGRGDRAGLRDFAGVAPAPPGGSGCTPPGDTARSSRRGLDRSGGRSRRDRYTTGSSASEVRLPTAPHTGDPARETLDTRGAERDTLHVVIRSHVTTPRARR